MPTSSGGGGTVEVSKSLPAHGGGGGVKRRNSDAVKYRWLVPVLAEVECRLCSGLQERLHRRAFALEPALLKRIQISPPAS